MIHTHLTVDFNLIGLPRQHSGKELPANAGDTRDVGSIPGSGRFPRGGNGTPVFLSRESHEQRSLAGYSPWVAKSRTRLSTHSVVVLFNLIAITV